MAATTRRTTLAAGAAALLAGADAVGDTHPDAELIRCCSAYIERLRAYEASAAPEPARQTIFREALAAEERALSIEARTLAGLRAKAEVAAILAADQPEGEDWGDSYTGDWPASVCQDLLRLIPGAVR